jgi:hypothetical protein
MSIVAVGPRLFEIEKLVDGAASCWEWLARALLLEQRVGVQILGARRTECGLVLLCFDPSYRANAFEPALPALPARYRNDEVRFSGVCGLCA